MFFSLTPHGIYTIRDTKIYKKESKRKKNVIRDNEETRQKYRQKVSIFGSIL